MPVLKLQVKGSSLKITQPFNLVSTQQNYDSCEFSFDSSWDGYAKTAIFYSDTTSKKSIELVDNKCVIPWENLVNDGILFIGVFGVNGTSVLPTNFVEQPLIPGSYVGADPTQPTEDIYVQLIGDMADFSSQEAARVIAESERASQELDRQTNTQNAITNANNATDSANGAATNANNAATNANDKATLANNAATNANNVATQLSNETLIIWKPYVATYADIATTYPTPEIKWTTIAQDTGIRWRYNGTEWVNIGVEPTDKVGDLTQLPTTDKTNTVNSIKELNTQLAAIENEMDVLEATLSQDYKSIFSSGTGKDSSNLDQDFNNKVEGQSSVKIDGLTANNLVTNGDFSNGTTGWTQSYSTLSVSNNVCQITGAGGNSGVGLYKTGVFSGGKKYFVRALVRITNSLCTKIDIGSSESFIGLSSPVQNKWYNITGIYNSNVTDGRMYIVERYIDANTAIGKVMEIKEVMAVDLTALGLDTLTLEQLKFMNDHYINGLQGTGSHKIVSVGKNLFDLHATPYGIWANALYTVNNDSLTVYNNISQDFCSIIYYLKGIPNATYKLTYNAIKNIVDSEPSVVIFGNPSGTDVIIGSNLTGDNTLSFIMPNWGYVGIRFNSTGGTITKGSVTYSNIQLEEGTIATTYEPYQSSEISVTLPRQLHRVPNGVADTVESVNNVPQVTYRNMEYILQSSDITSLYTSNTYVDIVSITKPSDCINPSVQSNGKLMIQGYTEFTETSGIDSISNIGKYHYASTFALVPQIIIAKGTYTNLADAQSKLAGTKIVYQLAVPVVYKNGENGFSQVGNLEVYKEGSIYIEPVTLKECTNPKTYITYNLSQKSVITENSGGITAINKRMSDWKTTNPWITPTLLNGWVPFNVSTDSIPAFYKDAFGFVHIKGLIKSGVTTGNTILFILPVGYRPDKTMRFITVSHNGTNQIASFLYINVDGYVAIDIGGNMYFSLDDITFKAVN